MVFAYKKSSLATANFGGHKGRDALRRQHSALSVAKAREEAMLQAVEPRRGSLHSYAARAFYARTPRIKQKSSLATANFGGHAGS